MRRNQISLFVFLSFILTFITCSPDKQDGKPNWKHNDNTVRVRLTADVQSLNPFLYRGGWTKNVFELIFQYPMDFDRKTVSMTPQTIISEPIVEDIEEGPYAGGQKISFQLLEEAAWDDGAPVTGHDYVFSMKTLFNPNLPLQAFASYLEMVRDIQVDENNSKKFTVFTDKKYYLALAAVSNITMLPEHIYDGEGLTKGFSFKEMRDGKAEELTQNENLKKFAEEFKSPKYSREVVSGSGPYQLSEWVDQQRIVLTKKQNWWGDALADKINLLAAYPDTIVFIPIKDQTAATTALKGEDIDVLLTADAKQFVEMKDNEFVTQTFDLQTPSRFVFFYTAIQNRNPKLSDKRVRNAIARLVDMDEVIRDLYNGLGQRMVGPFLPYRDYYNNDLELIGLDLDKARELLTEAGWTDTNGNGIVDKMIDGQLTEMDLEFLYTPGLSLQENLSELYKNNAKKVGINIERVAVESNVMGTRMRNANYELAGRGAGLIPGLPDDPKQMFHTESAQPGGSNYCRFGNAETDAIIDEIRTTTDVARRKELYLKFQEIIYDEQPMIFQFAPLDRIAVHKRFEAVYTALSPGVVLQHLKLKE